MNAVQHSRAAANGKPFEGAQSSRNNCAAGYAWRSTAATINSARFTESFTVAVSLGLGLMSIPLSRMQAMIEAASTTSSDVRWSFTESAYANIWRKSIGA